MSRMNPNELTVLNDRCGDKDRQGDTGDQGDTMGHNLGDRVPDDMGDSGQV